MVAERQRERGRVEERGNIGLLNRDDRSLAGPPAGPELAADAVMRLRGTPEHDDVGPLREPACADVGEGFGPVDVPDVELQQEVGHPHPDVRITADDEHPLDPRPRTPRRIAPPRLGQGTGARSNAIPPRGEVCPCRNGMLERSCIGRLVAVGARMPYSSLCDAHRACAALEAISDLRAFVRLAARATPPLRPPRRPRATAASFFRLPGGLLVASSAGGVRRGRGRPRSGKGLPYAPVRKVRQKPRGERRDKGMTAREDRQKDTSTSDATFNRNIWGRYRLTPDEFEALLRRQDGRCAACRFNGKLVVDHDHATGDVRGLLCLRCNLVIGSMRENIVHISGLIAYLNQPAVFTGEDLQDRPSRLSHYLRARVRALEAELVELSASPVQARPKDP